MNVKGKATAVLGLSAAAVLIAASPASASGGVSTPGGAATVDFVSNGDDFELWDNACDNHHVLFDFRTDYGRSGTREWTDSKCGQFLWYRFDFKEHSAIWYRVCVEDWGPNTCSNWRQDSTS